MSEPTVMRFSETDIEAARATLAKARPGEVVAIVLLTDEEVVILDGLQHEQLVPTPWLDRQEGLDLTVAGRVALRSLLAREMAIPEEQADGTTKVRAHPGITGALVLRRAARAIVSLERTTSQGKEWVFAYLHEEDGVAAVLEEEISESGQHGFAVYHRELLGERLQKFLDPTSAAVMGGETRTMSAPELEASAALMPELNEAVAVSILTGIVKGRDELVNVSVYTGPHGAYVVRGTEHDAGGSPVTYSLTETGPRGLRAIPEELVVA